MTAEQKKLARSFKGDDTSGDPEYGKAPERRRA
jgi:hypothetical protein